MPIGTRHRFAGDNKIPFSGRGRGLECWPIKRIAAGTVTFLRPKKRCDALSGQVFWLSDRPTLRVFPSRFPETVTLLCGFRPRSQRRARGRLSRLFPFYPLGTLKYDSILLYNAPNIHESQGDSTCPEEPSINEEGTAFFRVLYVMTSNNFLGLPAMALIKKYHGHPRECC